MWRASNLASSLLGLVEYPALHGALDCLEADRYQFLQVHQVLYINGRLGSPTGRCHLLLLLRLRGDHLLGHPQEVTLKDTGEGDFLLHHTFEFFVLLPVGLLELLRLHF